MMPSCASEPNDNEANIRVVVRVRPLNERELLSNPRDEGALQLRDDGGGSEGTITIDQAHVSHNAVTTTGRGDRGSLRSKSFIYDAVHGPQSTQDDIFESVRDIIDSVHAGFSGTVLAYGQTGSGKTHTIFGEDGSGIGANAGLVQRSLDAIFHKLSCSNEHNKRTTTTTSFFEIYNEGVYDLLDPSNNGKGLPVREDAKKGVYVQGLAQLPVSNAAEAMAVLHRGARNRRVASTKMNRASSRSHAVFVFNLRQEVMSDEGSTSIVKSKFTLVDLAGSERHKSTDTRGRHLREASMINNSLLCLGQVIAALVYNQSGKKKHIPFRDSKLSYILKDSFGGNSKTCLVATVTPSIASLGETISTLKFAQKAKKIKNAAVRNEDVLDSVASLKAEVAMLRSQLKNLGEKTEVEDSCNSVVATLKAEIELLKYVNQPIDSQVDAPIVEAAQQLMHLKDERVTVESSPRKRKALESGLFIESDRHSEKKLTKRPEGVSSSDKIKSTAMLKETLAMLDATKKKLSTTEEGKTRVEKSLAISRMAWKAEQKNSIRYKASLLEAKANEAAAKEELAKAKKALSDSENNIALLDAKIYELQCSLQGTKEDNQKLARKVKENSEDLTSKENQLVVFDKSRAFRQLGMEHENHEALSKSERTVDTLKGKLIIAKDELRQIAKEKIKLLKSLDQATANNQALKDELEAKESDIKHIIEDRNSRTYDLEKRLEIATDVSHHLEKKLSETQSAHKLELSRMVEEKDEIISSLNSKVADCEASLVETAKQLEYTQGLKMEALEQLEVSKEENINALKSLTLFEEDAARKIKNAGESLKTLIQEKTLIASDLVKVKAQNTALVEEVKQLRNVLADNIISSEIAPSMDEASPSRGYMSPLIVQRPTINGDNSLLQDGNESVDTCHPVQEKSLDTLMHECGALQQQLSSYVRPSPIGDDSNEGSSQNAYIQDNATQYKEHVDDYSEQQEELSSVISDLKNEKQDLECEAASLARKSRTSLDYLMTPMAPGLDGKSCLNQESSERIEEIDTDEESASDNASLETGEIFSQESSEGSSSGDRRQAPIDSPKEPKSETFGRESVHAIASGNESLYTLSMHESNDCSLNGVHSAPAESVQKSESETDMSSSSILSLNKHVLMSSGISSGNSEEQKTLQLGIPKKGLMVSLKHIFRSKIKQAQEVDNVEIERGDHVRVMSAITDCFGEGRREWRYGVVMEVQMRRPKKKHMIRIKYNDGGVQTISFPNNCIEKIHASHVQHIQDQQLDVGDRVDVYFQNGKYPGFEEAWLRGHVANITRDGSHCDVIYYDGLYEANIPTQNNIRLIERRDPSCKWMLGKSVLFFYRESSEFKGCGDFLIRSGTISNIHARHQCCDVTYSDSSTELMKCNKAAKAIFNYVLKICPSEKRFSWPAAYDGFSPVELNQLQQLSCNIEKSVQSYESPQRVPRRFKITVHGRRYGTNYSEQILCRKILHKKTASCRK